MTENNRESTIQTRKTKAFDPTAWEQGRSEHTEIKAQKHQLGF
jgi:hypothetical protein